MKRVVTLLLLAAALALAAALPVAADPPGDTPRACADITSGSVFYHYSSDPANTVTGNLTTVDPACGAVIFTLHIEYLSGTVLVTKSDSVHGRPTSTTVSGLAVTGASADGGSSGSVCAWFTSSFRGSQLDRAPNTDCVPVAADTGGGGNQGF
jgi:hypothetical protein